MQETDAIKQLVEYAKNQGSTHADKLYLTYSKLVKGLAGHEKRDAADTDTLILIMALERTLFGVVTAEMVANTHYGDIYQKVKRELTQLKVYWAIPALKGAS